MTIEVNKLEGDFSKGKLIPEDMKTGALFQVDVNPQGKKTYDWIQKNNVIINNILSHHGALLIRGLPIGGSRQFGTLLQQIFGMELLPYIYRSTPRTELKGHVFTATEYHSDLLIPQHNENSYSNNWPTRIGFLCVVDSDTGGATPIANSRNVYLDIPLPIREKFESKGVMYVRNYSDIDLPWDVVFGTKDRSEVEHFCLNNNINCEWSKDGSLRTTQVNPSFIVHPESKERIWFNQAHLFHISSLDKQVTEDLLKVVGTDRLPRNAYYGDGSEIEPEALELIRKSYEKHTIRFSWRRNDLLLLDNMRFSHGRESYIGDRKVLTGMAGPSSFISNRIF
ncbi:TauD/TfdA family dioxygenase [Microbulbifer sp. GL-2]|uniref:TauD/TfdA family dioxygenase n=1 Tax=Microbulbifer sp. GL-2 TaxID=2591606 RepID=UPI001162F3C5|nr:TauD/TfdA family dioxygenase [Microbulbifer sp. GL-2]BBM00790.1 hypothetical protein GL2_08640 [Microbulbifer sp. GL-2]